MGFALGLDAKLYRNTGTYATPVWDEITNVRDLTLPLTHGEADATTRGNGGWEAIVTALKKASVDFESVWDTADTDFAALLAAWVARTVIEFAIMDGDITVPGKQGLRASCQVVNIDRAEPLDGVQMASVSIKPTYSANAPSWYTVPTPP